MTVTSTKDFTSIGVLAAHLQRPVRRIEQAVESLRIEPALRLNGVVHFDGAQVERIVQAIVTHDQQAGTLQQRRNIS